MKQAAAVTLKLTQALRGLGYQAWVKHKLYIFLSFSCAYQKYQQGIFPCVIYFFSPLNEMRSGDQLCGVYQSEAAPFKVE